MNDCVLQRKNAEFIDFRRFVLSTKKFDKQYNNIYNARLAALRNSITEVAKAKWASYQIVTLAHLMQEGSNEKCIVIGTLYKQQRLKPSILREVSAGLQLNFQPPALNYVSSNDTVFLEDESLRVKLVGEYMNPQEVVTGLICGLLGCPQSDGTFLVEDWCFLGCCPKPSTSDLFVVNRGRVLIVSDLSFINCMGSIGLELLSEWICGMAASPEAQEDASRIVNVILAGNSVGELLVDRHGERYRERKIYDRKLPTDSLLAVRKLDIYLSSIVKCCEVTLIPGEFDPTSYTLPQQPIHPCVLPESHRFKSLHGVTNPWVGRIGSRVIAGSSGQPIKDIMKVAGLVNDPPISWLEKTLYWRHYAPTAPDTLPAYPYCESDPFIMHDCPDIYFAGNMNEYSTKLLTVAEGHVIRLVCVPKFSKTQTAVIVDLQDLECWPISFGTS